MASYRYLLQSKSETLEEISVVEAWLKERPWVSHFVPHLVVVQDWLKRLRNPPAPSSNPFEGTRLARGGPRSLQRRSAVGGSSPVQPSQRHQPAAPSDDRYLGGCWARGGPRSLQRGSGVEGGWWRGGIHSRSLSLQQHAQGHQPPPAPTGPHPDPVPAPRRRLPANVSRSPTSVVLTAASAPVPALCRRIPADVSRSPTSVVLTAASAPFPAPRRKLLADVFAGPAPVPIPRRRVPADATLVPASGSSRCQLLSLSHAGGPQLTFLIFGLTSLLFRSQKSLRSLLQSLSRTGESQLKSLLFRRRRSSQRRLWALFRLRLRILLHGRG
ncbi:unnamed protein product [Pleuronectes platessa]|uniref:Uncharacterized protein n=1 Tax=Pleuronectes platessa TaxID=8262 RepID=A0A9N7Z5E4_PLEPL|nr:unnamed protein product [Pleuronectes platessa]